MAHVPRKHATGLFEPAKEAVASQTYAHTKMCASAIANLGARVSRGNPRGVEGRRD